eukprot:scaffold1323_cov106-Skeletonema_marinoi.AAC.8
MVILVGRVVVIAVRLILANQRIRGGGRSTTNSYVEGRWPKAFLSSTSPPSQASSERVMSLFR